MNAVRRHLVLAALLADLAAAPVAAENECLSIRATGAQSSTIFADGFESGNTTLWDAPFFPSYSLPATDDLTAEVLLDAAIAGDHLLELRWKLANGQLYQSVAVPFSVGAVAAGSKRVVPGYPFPVEIAAALPARPANAASAIAAPQGANAVTSALPVAGTSIVETGLSGDWYLEAFLDESETPCGATFQFRLVP